MREFVGPERIAETVAAMRRRALSFASGELTTGRAGQNLFMHSFTEHPGPQS